MRGGRAIPLILSIDVEPDGFQSEAARSTTGCEAAIELLSHLRPMLAQATGRAPSFGWFFRMDHQIEALLGRADALVARFETQLQDLVDAGDHLGLHTHLVRWSAEQRSWVHDLTDPTFVREAIASSFTAYEECFGTRCERHRMGAALFDQSVVGALGRSGTRVESSFEPVRSFRVDGRAVSSGVDTSPLLGRTTDCARSPRAPYRPDEREFRRAGGGPGGLVLLPLTCSWRSPTRPAWQMVVGSMAKRRRLPRMRPFYLGETASPAEYWDVIARQVRLMRRPYINVALRTGAADSVYFGRVRSALEALVEHPLASRVEVVDPLVALPRLLAEPTARADWRDADVVHHG